MGLGDMVAKTILTQLFFKGALGCTTPAEWWNLFQSWAKHGGGVLEGV